MHDSTETDIDECAEDIHDCEQTCNDTRGSYICSCNVGFRLADDGHACNGTYILHQYLLDISLHW